MSIVTELNRRLEAITEAGVSVWLDQIRRSKVQGGELARMVAVESLRGVTPNTLRSRGLAAERVELDGDPAQAVRSLTDRIKEILERS